MTEFTKRIISVLLSMTLALTALLTLCIGSFAVNSNITDFRVSAGAGTLAASKDDIGVVSWWYNENDGKYYVFLPSGSSMLLMKVWYTANGSVTVNNETLVNGAATTAFAAGGEYTIACNGENYQTVFLKSSSLPAIFINTDSGSMDFVNADKENKEAGKMLAIDKNGLSVYDGELKQIKGRGNNTWTLPKRPYNIKLKNSTNLFGMGKSKNWCLLANYNDLSLLRNQIIYNLALGNGLESSCDNRQVDLYLNGQYNGTYLITEKVEIDKNRVNITDLEALTEEANSNTDLSTFAAAGTRGKYSGLTKGQKWYEIPNNPADITGGYILEYEIPDRYPNEASGFVTSRGQSVVLKSPEYASEEQVKYISSFVQEMEDALYSPTGYNSLGKHYSEYIDIESLARMYVIQEWSENLDAGISSFYLYKDAGSGKLYAGPVWDFDIALGNSDGRFGYDLKDPEIEWARNTRLYKNTIFGQLPVKYVPTILNALYSHTDFVNEVNSVWDKDFKPSVDTLVASGISSYENNVKDSAVMNAIRWNSYGTTDISAVQTKYASDVDYISNFAAKRTAFLDGKFGLENEALTVSKIGDQAYTGSALTPSVTVKCLDKTLTEGTDYTVTYSNNTAVGKATVTVQGIGSYGTSESASFKIVSSSSGGTNSSGSTSGGTSGTNSVSIPGGNTSSKIPKTATSSDKFVYFLAVLPMTAAAAAIIMVVIARKKQNDE